MWIFVITPLVPLTEARAGTSGNHGYSATLQSSTDVLKYVSIGYIYAFYEATVLSNCDTMLIRIHVVVRIHLTSGT